MQMQAEDLSQRARLRIALEIDSDRTGERRTIAWFARQHDVGRHAIHQVLAGRTTSARLEEAIESYIEEQLGTTSMDALVSA